MAMCCEISWLLSSNTTLGYRWQVDDHQRTSKGPEANSKATGVLSSSLSPGLLFPRIFRSVDDTAPFYGPSDTIPM